MFVASWGLWDGLSGLRCCTRRRHRFDPTMCGFPTLNHPSRLTEGIMGNPHGSTTEVIAVNRHQAMVVVFGLLVSTTFGQESNQEDRLPAPTEGKQWKLVWHDEFDGSTLDESKWETPPDGRRRDCG